MQDALSAPAVGGIVRRTIFILKGTFIFELLGAAVMLGGAVQAARGALAGERLGGGRAGRIAAAGCALLAALAAWALVGQGFDGARLAMPLLALPALVLALCAGRL